jgi:hypothetical protein
MPEPVRSVETTGLAWGVRSSFRRYVERVALGAVIPDGGVGSLPDGRFYFPVHEVRVLDREALDAQIAFSGGLRFLGHAGMIDLRLGELELAITGGEGTLRTSSPGGARELVDVQVTQTSADDTLTALVLRSRLAAGAEELFDNVYAAATTFDDLEVRVTVVR